MPMRPKRVAHLRGARVRAQQAIDTRRAERHAARLVVNRVRVNDADSDSTAGPLRQQLRRAIRADTCEARLLALLEAQAGLAAQRVAESGAADRDRIEHGRLHDHRGRRVRHLAVCAAHDAGDADRAARVGDDQRVGRQRPR